MTLLSELQSLLGPSHVLTGADADGYVQDWRRRYRGAALAAVRPGSTDEVAGVVRLCLRHGVPVVPQGGNTGLCGGATPDASGSAVVLSTARLNRVMALDTDNDTITVEAGCVLQAVQDAAAEAGRLFPLSLAAEGSCTIGGNLATNAGGTQCCATAIRGISRWGWRSLPPTVRSGTACAACARTIPATICATCISAAKAHWASSPPPR